jgi:hypothetical protein
MDKNMINIDELVKLRLSGGEEHERPGSWANMRELLDQKMPANKSAAAYNWRRMLGVMTGLALLGALSIGGYQVMSTKFANGNGQSGPATANTAGTAPHSNGAGLMAANKPADKSTLANNNTEASTSVTTTKTSARGTSTSATNKTNSQTKAGIGNKPAIASANSNASSSVKEVANNNQPVTAANSVASNTTNAATNPAHPIVDNSPVATASNNTPVAAANNSIVSSNNNTNTNNVNANSNPVNAPASGSVSNKSIANDPQLDALANLSAAVPDNTNTAKIKTPAPLEPALPKDSFRKMTVVQRSVINPVAKTSTLITDTVSVERFAMDKQISTATDQQSQQALARTNDPAAPVNPSSSISLAAAKADAGASEVFVSLSNFKVKSRKTSKWDAQGFRDKMQDVKFNLAQIRFYPGVSAGYSYMSTRNISGVQFGLFGLVTFGEHWNAMTEIKYSHRFNSGTVLDDSYSIIKPSGTGFLQSKVENFFKFTTLQSIEMPIALRYAAGRLNLFGGINLNYNFAIDAEQVTVYPDESAYAPTVNPNWADNKPTITYNDFHSRFAMGYLLGAGYELSPAIQLDLRATKNVWDNAKRVGAEQVSQQLFRAPTFQVSIFYRFSQRNQIPKAK